MAHMSEAPSPFTSTSPQSDPLYADVIVPRHLAHSFTYSVPSHLRAVLRVGHVVFVPFGRSLVQGAVIALMRTHPPELDRQRLKEIRALVSAGRSTEIHPALFQLAKLVAETYVAPWGQCLRLVLPPRAATADGSRIMLTTKGREAMAANESAVAQALPLLKRLRRRPLGIHLSRLLIGKDRCREEVLTEILDQGLAQKIPGRTGGPAGALLPADAVPNPDLLPVHDDESNPDVNAPYLRKWQAHIGDLLEKRQAVRVLLEAAPPQRLALLRDAVARTVALGRRVLVITGETARAESLSPTLNDPSTVSVCFHSATPETKKVDIWRRVGRDEVSVVVGTRSAVFLPLDSIGLIWIDREEDPALKEPMEPRYHVRDVAWMRAQDEDALLVMASAHLSLEASAMGRPEHLLKAPFEPASFPKVEVVDLRGQNRTTLLSSTLVEAMREAIFRHAGIVLFLNRRAYAGALVCRDCGQVPRCRMCAVAMALSREKHALLCHYCGATELIPDLCAACGGSRLQPVGEGTERVEEEVKRRFPSVRVLRVDGETMRRPKEAAELWKRIHRREWDVLVGTQLILREDVLRPVGVVGLVQADAGLSLPDFRAAERTYQLFRDAAALTYPLSQGGRLIIQSFLPSHHAVQAIAQHDEAIFQSEELSHRAILGFPPHRRLIVLHVSGPTEERVAQAADRWAARLNALAEHGLDGRGGAATSPVDVVTILGPVQSPVPRIRGRYRRQILVKSRCGGPAVEAIRSTLTELEEAYPPRQVKFDVDVDPIDMW
jgi:primosomal protein N' (replication factor Y) (superfamily II helicase)